MMKEPDSNANLTASLRRTHRWRMAVSGLVILAAGITLGVAGTLLVVRPTETRPPMPIDRAVRFMLGRFRDELNLTPDQSEQIRVILRGHFAELESLRREARPKISKVFPGRPGEGFRDGRGPFRGPGGPRPDGERDPGQWRRDGRRPEGNAGSWRRRPDANAAPASQESREEQKPPDQEPEPNTP